MKYMTTYDGYRYLTSEIAIANGRRSIPDIHWNYAASKTIERIARYEKLGVAVDFLIAPSKVTALSYFFEDYFPSSHIFSWGANYVENLIKFKKDFLFYFNPTLISKKELFFKYDSHWNCLGALNYFQPWLKSKFNIEDDYFSKLLRINEKCIGNCIAEANKKPFEENYYFFHNENFNIVYSVRDAQLPDFSVLKTKNSDSIIDERVLIIHSSNYEFARGFFSPLFRETIEIFSPYVSDEVVSKGNFDRVILIPAERNSAVVYDGGYFGDAIKNALNQIYIKEISNSLLQARESENLISDDIDFFHALANSWSGYGS